MNERENKSRNGITIEISKWGTSSIEYARDAEG